MTLARALAGLATFGPLIARIVLRGEMVPPGSNAQTLTIPFTATWRAAA